MKDFDQFLKEDFTYCILLDFHINILSYAINTLHEHGKKGIVHIDLVKGLSNDEYGCEFLCQTIRVDGIISTKAKVIESAKKNNKIAILRLFLIDSKSLEKGMSLANALQPDFIEVLPGIAYEIISFVRRKTSVPVIGGGLIKTIDQIHQSMEAGTCAVTIGNFSLCKQYRDHSSANQYNGEQCFVIG